MLAGMPGGAVAHDRASIRADHDRMRAALADLPPRPGTLDRLVRATVRAGFALAGWRVRTTGLELLPRGAGGDVVPCVVAVAPHRGWVDPFVVLLAWPAGAPRLAWFGDERTMARSWWRRRLLPRLGMIPIPPVATSGAMREHLVDARIVLERGCCLVVFPEKGPPSPAGRTRAIASGAAWLAAEGRVPLVPVAIGGFLETGLGTRYRLRVLPPLAHRGFEPGTIAGMRAARATTARLRAALDPAVAELEAATKSENGQRPLPGLRRLFH
jgi:1-acyl-sn-glycerol-3-phosphate acyltransferase